MFNNRRLFFISLALRLPKKIASTELQNKYISIFIEKLFVAVVLCSIPNIVCQKFQISVSDLNLISLRTFPPPRLTTQLLVYFSRLWLL